MVAMYKIGDTLVREGKFGAVFVRKVSSVSHKPNVMAMTGATAHQIADWLSKAWRGEPRKLVQDEFPLLTKEEREFLISGITPTEWREIFPPEDKEEADGQEI